MTILALETSTPHASLAVWRDGAVVREWEFYSERGHNAAIFDPLADALATADPTIIAVGTGPGSYAGVRVALAAGLGLALARRLPLIGWPSLSAFDHGPAPAWIVGDARRGGYFLARLTDGHLTDPPEIMELHHLRQRIAAAPVWTFDPLPPIAEARTARPTAAWLARRVAALTEAERVALAAATPEPLYLRAPFITTPRPPAGNSVISVDR